MLHNFLLMNQKLSQMRRLQSEFHADFDEKYFFFKISVCKVNNLLLNFEFHLAVFENCVVKKI